MALIKKDSKTLVDYIKTEIEQAVSNEIKPLCQDINAHQSSVDKYIKQT